LICLPFSAAFGFRQAPQHGDELDGACVGQQFSKSGMSVSVGARHAWYMFGGRRGDRVTIGAPGGLGLYYTEHIPPAVAVRAHHQGAFLLVCVALAIAVMAIYGWALGGPLS